MEDALKALPDDPAALKALVLAMAHQRDQVAQQRDQVARQRDQVAHQRDEVATRLDEALRGRDQWKLRHDQKEVERLRLEVELLRLRKLYYGRKADNLTTVGEVNQMLLDFGRQLEARPLNPDDLPPDVDPATVDLKTIRRVRTCGGHKGRRNLAQMDHLPTTQHIHDLKEQEKPCPCCGELRHAIGQESSWQIEYIPARFERIEHVRIKYACKACEGNGDNPNIELADKPLAPIDKGLAGPGLLAYVVTSKYADYLPLYRLEAIFDRNGFAIDRATQSVWCGDVADLLRPLYELMIQRVRQSHVIATDDTIMPMLAPGKTRKARMWVYVGDEANPYNVFDFTPGRGRDGPMTFLKDFRQTLLADGYGGYDGVVVGNDLTRAGCWAHARRKFVDAEKTAPAIAREAVGLIARLYAIEAKAKERALSHEDRLCLRQAETQPILDHLQTRLWSWKDSLLPKHPMNQAAGYALNQWKALTVFAGDGAVPIDNNISEREMKRIVLNRKNSLFVGNPRGGHTAAILATLTSTCRRHNIDPQLYLTHLLTNLPSVPMSQLPDWLPDQWQRTHTSPSA